MKPPADINSCREMADILTNKYGMERREVESIIDRVFIEYAKADKINANVIRSLR